MPRGQPGTVYFEGGATFEYHNDSEKTSSSRHAKGWTTLGDVGYLDDDNFLYLTDRKSVHDHQRRCEHLSRKRWRTTLVTHPKVIDVAVFGVPNDEFGEEVKAVVQPVADAVVERGIRRRSPRS